MGFCILGGKESYLRKTLSDLLTSLGEAVGIGATPAQFSEAISDIYTDRYTAGQDSLKVNRKLTLTESQTGTNVDITDNWYTSVNASAVYNAGKVDAHGNGHNMSVFILPDSSQTGTGYEKLTVTETLKGNQTYRLAMILGGLSDNYWPTVTLAITGGSTRTYGKTHSSGSGEVYGTGPMYLYWSDTFTLSSATTVTLSIAYSAAQGTNHRNGVGVAAIK